MSYKMYSDSQCTKGEISISPILNIDDTDLQIFVISDVLTINDILRDISSNKDNIRIYFLLLNIIIVRIFR